MWKNVWSIIRKAAEALHILNRADVVDVNEAEAIRDVVVAIDGVKRDA
jgi:hypothetical protein